MSIRLLVISVLIAGACCLFVERLFCRLFWRLLIKYPGVEPCLRWLLSH